MTINFRRVH